MPEFDAPHRQPEQPPPSSEKLARKLPVATVVIVAVSAAGVALVGWLVWTALVG